MTKRSVFLDLRIKTVARESDIDWLLSEIRTPSVFGARRDERESECWNSKVLISGWLESGYDRGSKDENLFKIGLPKLSFQSQCFIVFLRP